MHEGRYERYVLRFLFEARTSREKMWEKETYFVTLYDSETGRTGRGECALFRGLSADDRPDYTSLLEYYCAHPHEAPDCPYSSIRMGFETALRDLESTDGCLFPGAGPWVDGREGIVINGLVWMGDKATMLRRVREKIDAGFSVLKLKIGGINFEEECEILAAIRQEYAASDLTIRLDANGSFTPRNALQRLDRLSNFDIHSLEQPIAACQAEESARICRESPIAIALDEELIGCRTEAASAALLDAIKPQYIILKPTLCGGFAGADSWISEAEKRNIGWWATSALESNVGLNAIAQWVAAKRPTLPQGLGTGQLYANNTPTHMMLRGEKLYNDGLTSKD
ncbi:MAG: o-succinylbenzoate synthase [Muribaculaceae bacterium]|nr:o-succinylbenzoate synthase [Muribaculaceae bacterium]